MSRAVLGVDRLVGLVVSLLLITGGGLAVLWGTRRLGSLTAPLDLAIARRALGESWWPWAVGGPGLLLMVLGLWWLLAHVPAHGVPRILLPGSGRPGRLSVEARPLADAAAAALAPTLGVQQVRGRIRRERGMLALRLNAVLDPDADLRLVAESAEQVSGQVRHLLGRDDVTCMVSLRIASRVARRTRVT